MGPIPTDDQGYADILARLRALHERQQSGWIGDIAAASEWEDRLNAPGYGIPQRTRKEEGELAELAFSYAANKNGVKTAKPEGETFPFDRISIWRHAGGFTLRTVQVKCTSAGDANGSYVLNVARQSGPYLPGDFDFVAGLVVPVDAWYIIPLHALRNRTAVTLHPQCLRPEDGGDCDRYRGRWELLC
jgi:hypothetical protein